LNRISKIIHIRTNEPVRFKSQNFDLLIPYSHHLPLFIEKYPLYSLNLQRITRYLFDIIKDLKIIDVGANVGDSAQLIKQIADIPILCIEGNETYFNYLQKNVSKFKNVTLVNSFVGKNNRLTNIVELNDNIGSSYLRFDKESKNKLELKSLDYILNDKFDYISAKIIKIDTEGFDYFVLQGAKKYLINTKPVIFFEYSPCMLINQECDPYEVFDYLYDLGYEYLILYDNYGNLVIILKNNDPKLKALSTYLLSRKNYYYYDIVAFNKIDYEIYKNVLNLENDFYKSYYNIN
jgi:FkbM family methyltransferase